MSDAIPLPPRPNLEHYRKQAKDLRKACASRDAAAIAEWALGWLSDLARLQPLRTPSSPEDVRRETMRMQRRWRRFLQTHDPEGRCSLAAAQLFIAREHGFASWPKFAAHVAAMNGRTSVVSNFEAAADAVVDGDINTLRRLLHDDPGVVTARSSREHRSTLLHYVSANGVEDFRQRTPPNILEITQLLLDAGADVNAESDAYGGRSTTLGLTATSWHPEHAGVQVPLMELLIRRGAAIDGPDGSSAVNACLHNGRGEAAEFLARLGARLDLEGAAGVGRLDVVRSHVDEHGRLMPPATMEQLRAGFAAACQFGRTAVVGYLLDGAIPADGRLPDEGCTGLHWAAFGGHADTVRLLLARGARVDITDSTYGGTPLGWALYAWGGETSSVRAARYYDVVASLVSAGAVLDPRWYAEDDERRRAWDRLQADPAMAGALGLGGHGSNPGSKP